MLIVAGHFEVDPADREAFVAGRVESMTSSRAEAGCLEYAITADPLDPARVLLFERWEDQASLDGHLAALAEGGSKATGPAPKGFDVKIYDISGVRDFG